MRIRNLFKNDDDTRDKVQEVKKQLIAIETERLKLEQNFRKHEKIREGKQIKTEESILKQTLRRSSQKRKSHKVKSNRLL